MRIVRAILIDPFAKTVTEVEHDADDYKGVYALLSHETHPVDIFTAVGLGGGDSVFVDDEGLFKEGTSFFIWHGYAQPLAGKGLILGCDDEGETVACKMSLSKAQSMVSFALNIELSHMESIDEMVDHPILGRVPMVGSRPVFKLK